MIVFKKILFPTDFSVNADKALAHALRLADFDGGDGLSDRTFGCCFRRYTGSGKGGTYCTPRALLHVI